MTDTTNSKNIYQRIAEAMEEVTYVQKNKPSGMQYSIVSHDAVTAKVRPALLKVGVVYHPANMEVEQNGNRTEVRLDVVFVNIDDPTDRFVVPSLGYGIDNQDKGPGKAVSYAVKYALLKALGLETGDDPDLDQSTEHEPTAAPVEKKMWHGPLKTMELKKQAGDFGKTLALVQTVDALNELLNDPQSKAMLDQLQVDLPQWWDWPEEERGLGRAIDNKRTELEAKE